LSGEACGADEGKDDVHQDKDIWRRRVDRAAVRPAVTSGGDIEPSCTASQRLLKIDRLSRRELGALAHAASGETDRQIAEHVVITHRTVRSFFT
jgi:DNA-binding NarL/FixJ family response regulator